MKKEWAQPGTQELDGFETVYTVEDWYDGPERGFADYGGRPHAYVRMFDPRLDEYSSGFELWPIDAQTLQWGRERWALWLRWREAFHRGWVDTSSHPALPEDRARHEELSALLGQPWLQPPGTQAVRARGDFRAPVNGEEGELRVQWTKWESTGEP